MYIVVGTLASHVELACVVVARDSRPANAGDDADGKAAVGSWCFLVDENN
jgi:hypothetical protein